MEIIFVLGAIFIAYVVHGKLSGESTKEVEPVEVALKEPEVSIIEKPIKKQEKVVVEKKNPVAKKTKATTSKAKPKPKAKSKANTTFPTGTLKDPETGDIVKLANSYQMMRRWMKEALVTEGLLEKIYKTNEMNDEVEATIVAAITKLQKMDKYK